MKEDTDYIRTALPALQADTSAVKTAQEMQDHTALCEWLSPIDFSSQQHDIITRRQAGTGQWFLDTKEFDDWMHGPEKTLFCPGIPGAGKTMIAAIAIDHLRQRVQSRSIEVAYLFCSYKRTARLSASDLFAALLRQLIQSRPDSSAVLTDLYNNCIEFRRRPTFEEIIAKAQTICQNYVTLYIVVDALDECTSQDSVRGTLINRLRQLQAKVTVDLRLMFTSRFIPEISQAFMSTPTLEVRASSGDIESFVSGQIPHLAKCLQRDEDLRYQVQARIVEAVDGM